MNLLKLIRNLENETYELRKRASFGKVSFEESQKLRQKQDIKWKQLQTLKRMVNKNGIN